MNIIILLDLLLFLFIYIGTRWIGWSMEETLSSKTGFVLLVFSAFLIAKKGFIKPFKLSKSLATGGIVLLLLSFALSFQARSYENIILVEGDSSKVDADEKVKLEQVIVQDSPGLIRNDIYADLKVIDSSNETNKWVKIMPPSFINGYLWRVLKFGFAPVLTLKINGKTAINDKYLVFTMENWTSEAESKLIEAGLARNPPPRIMLGVGAFPPEMEAIVDLDQVGLRENYLFFRLSKTNVNGKKISLDGDDYWRYLVNGRLRDPVLKIGLIKNKKLTKIQEVKIGDLLKWNNSSVKFDDLKYWVEIERRWDPFIPVIIASFLITYLGIAISIIQYVANFFRSLRAKRSNLAHNE